MIAVDHRAPRHDALCRCSACKPAHPADPSEAEFRISLALFLLALIVIGLVLR